MGSKSDVSAFFRLRFRNGLGTKPAGALPFRMRSRRSFLRLCLVAEVSLCLVAEVSQWLGHDSIVFRGSKSNVSRFLRLQFRKGLDAKPAGSFFLFNGFQKRRFGMFPAAVSQWLVRVARALFLCFFFVFCLFLVGSKSDVSAFFRLRFRNGLGTKPAGALPFRMRSRRSFLRLCLVAEVSLCLVAEVSQWLGHDSIVFRGSKSNVSRFLRLQFRNGLDAKPAGSFFLFNGFQKRRFGMFPAAVSQWLVRVARALFLCFFFVFCLFLVGSKSDVSAFFRLRFRNGLGTKPAGALPFRMRSRRSFLRLCLVAEVSQWLGHALFLVGSKNNVSALFWLRFRMMWALYFFLFWALYFFLFSGFQKRRFGFAMARAQNLLGFCFFARASQTPFSWVWPGGLQAFSLFLVGSKSNVSAVFWLRFRMVWALFLSFFLMGSKSDVSAFFRLRFRNGLFAWLGHYFFVFSLFFVCF